MVTRRFHRLLGIVFGLFLLTSAITGLLWAYAPYLYWKPGYKHKKASLPLPPLTDAVVSIPIVIRRVQESEEGKIEAESVLLRKDFGRLLYEIEYEVNGAKSRLLIDAKSGVFLSPLTEELAIVIARQYVEGNAPVESAILLSDWVPRKKTKGVKAFRVRFQDAGKTEIFLDPQTGRILEEQDHTRRFHFLVMQFHQLNFFGFRKVLTIIPGLSLLFMIATGTYLWISQVRRRRLRRLRSPCELVDEGISRIEPVLLGDGTRKESDERRERY